MIQAKRWFVGDMLQLTAHFSPATDSMYLEVASRLASKSSSSYSTAGTPATRMLTSTYGAASATTMAVALTCGDLSRSRDVNYIQQALQGHRYHQFPRRASGSHPWQERRAITCSEIGITSITHGRINSMWPLLQIPLSSKSISCMSNAAVACVLVCNTLLPAYDSRDSFAMAKRSLVLARIMGLLAGAV